MIFKKAIITSGPTREWIDPVRFISNASSGKMGYCIAVEIQKWIANVVYIHGNVLERYENVDGAKCISVETTINLRDSLISELTEDTILIMAAAPADFRPKHIAKNKIKKSPTEGLTIELEQNPDILKSIHSVITETNLQNVRLIGFAAETENLEENAKGKLVRKGLSLIIGNYVGLDKGFGDTDSSIRIFSSNGLELEIQDQSKEVIAFEIIQFLKNYFQSN